MSDLISRQAAIDTLKMDYTIIPYAKARDYVKATLDEIWDRLDKLPSAVPERPKGKWTLNADHSATCSVCGHTQLNAWDVDNSDNFCHFCGADMREFADDIS